MPSELYMGMACCAFTVWVSFAIWLIVAGLTYDEPEDCTYSLNSWMVILGVGMFILHVCGCLGPASQSVDLGFVWQPVFGLLNIFVFSWAVYGTYMVFSTDADDCSNNQINGFFYWVLLGYWIAQCCFGGPVAVLMLCLATSSNDSGLFSD